MFTPALQIIATKAILFFNLRLKYQKFNEHPGDMQSSLYNSFLTNYGQKHSNWNRITVTVYQASIEEWRLLKNLPSFQWDIVLRWNLWITSMGSWLIGSHTTSTYIYLQMGHFLDQILCFLKSSVALVEWIKCKDVHWRGVMWISF